MPEKDLVNRIAQLLRKHLDGSASEAETRELNDWKDQSAANTQLYNEWMDPATRESKLLEYMSIDAQAAAEGQVWRDNLPQEVTDRFQGRTFRVISLRKILYVAAAVVFIVLLSVKYLVHRPEKLNATSVPVIAKNDVPAPIGSKTTLTLSNGAKIVLDNVREGILSRQGNADIIKSKDGQLVYEAAQQGSSVQLSYNTLTTAIGGQSQLLLADGTKVWLNSASSITYPTSFSGKDRAVKITGQAYFEIAKDKSKPFVVTAQDMNVEVLGTHFDINGYGDERTIKTTLLEGSVKVVSGGRMMLLKPGQQTQVSNDGKLNLIDKIDTEIATAWLNGKFAFEDENISLILKQLARWYDLEISYDGTQPNIQLTASVSKRSSLSAVLKVLEISGVHFRLEGKKLIVK